MQYFTFVNRSVHDDHVETELQAFFDANPDIVIDYAKFADRGGNFHITIVYHKDTGGVAAPSREAD